MWPLLIIIVHGVTMATAKIAGCMIMDGTYIGGWTNVRSQYSPSGVLGCARLCTSTRGCQAWTLKKLTNRCFLKKSGVLKIRRKGWISGVKCEGSYSNKLTIPELHTALSIQASPDQHVHECYLQNTFQGSNPNQRGADANNARWSGGVVPYVLDPSLTEDDRLVFAKAICDISMQACIRFSSDSSLSALTVRRECDCGDTSCGFAGAYSNGLGYSSSRELVISRACLSPSSQSDVGLMIHELLHVLGVGHTQTRPDRNAFITVNYANIESGKHSQYQSCPTCSTHGTAYDCDSIMHYLDTFFQIPGAGPTMTAVNPATCDLGSYNAVLRPSDIQLIRAMYPCDGVDLYLRIQGIDMGTHCEPAYKLPGHFSFKSPDGKIDLNKLYNLPYGGTHKYWTKFGGYGIAENTGFSGCIDDNNQENMHIIGVGGLLKFSGLQVPGWYGSGGWETTIWINVMSQCQSPGQCDVGTGHWWKFEKSLSEIEAKQFAYTHLIPELADASVAGEPVVLQYMGQVTCTATASYGCDPGEEN